MGTLRGRQLGNDQCELTRLNERKDHFLALLAHELRNPLASIVNALELLHSPAPEDASKIIEGQVKQLSRLISDLQDLSCVTRGKIVLRKIPLDLVETVRDAAHAARGALFKNGQRFLVELPSAPLWVQADPVRLGQIVSNLLANAAKFTGPGKQIRLVLEHKAETAVLRVNDDGIGIPANMLESIFEPFVQVENGSLGGLGLGLPLVRQLASLHGGSVHVHSEGPGRGAEFTIHLPLTAAPTIAPSQATPPAVVQAIACRVLVIEDNVTLGNTLQRLLAHWGHEPQLITTGAEALEKTRAFHPQVALIDIGLPDIDGFSVAEQLRQPGNIRLIAMSGYSSEEMRTHAREAGFHEFLLKPVDPAALRRLLEG